MGKSKGRTGSRKRSNGSKKRSSEDRTEPKSWMEEEKEEIGRMEEICAGSWLAFTISKARWLKFTVDEAIQHAFDSPVGSNKDQVLAWVRRAEASVVQWILRELILRENRVEQFRRLGRGWLFVLLRRPERKFKVWFESVRRITKGHQMDLQALNLTGEKLEKHTFGYLFQSELVFFIKGLVNGSGTQPTISIQKLHPGYKDLAKWATSEEVMEACKRPELATDEQRKLVAAKTQRRQRQKLRERAQRQEVGEEETASASHCAPLEGGAAYSAPDPDDSGTECHRIATSTHGVHGASFGDEQDKGSVPAPAAVSPNASGRSGITNAVTVSVGASGEDELGLYMYPSVALVLGYRYRRPVANEAAAKADAQFERLLRMFKAEDAARSMVNHR